MLFMNKARQIKIYVEKGKSAKLAALLQTDKPETRIQVIHALGKLDDDIAANALINQLSDPDPATRLEVIKTMGTKNNQIIKSHLQHLVQVETDESIKKIIREAISDIPNKNYGTKQSVENARSDD
jgi:HEAT repeat protein